MGKKALFLLLCMLQKDKPIWIFENLKKPMKKADLDYDFKETVLVLCPWHYGRNRPSECHPKIFHLSSYFAQLF